MNKNAFWTVKHCVISHLLWKGCFFFYCMFYVIQSSYFKKTSSDVTNLSMYDWELKLMYDWLIKIVALLKA